MDIEASGSASLDERITRAVLNAMQPLQASGGGMGPAGVPAVVPSIAPQPPRGGFSQRGGGWRGGRGGRFGGRRGASVRTVAGVPPAVVEQRRAVGQCFRCGSGDHRMQDCTNASSATQPQPLN
jgi:hypothetical protein